MHVHCDTSSVACGDSFSSRRSLKMDKHSTSYEPLEVRRGYNPDIPFYTINGKWKRGTYATVTDVKTGIQFKVYRFGGWFHADCEPATAADTAKMKKACGGSWTWNRRPIWVTINGVTYAASQHDMPHMVDVVADNDFPGHFCIHFNHSKVHETNAECPRHQACVQYAYKKAK